MVRSPSPPRVRAIEYEADVRSGYVAAYRRDIGPPSETPISAARLEPVASNTALTSSMRSSSVGIATRSERPVPRLSKRIRREKEASRRKNLAGRGCSQSYSKCETNPGTQKRSKEPSPRTWYAMWTSPLLTYLVLGGSDMPLSSFAAIPWPQKVPTYPLVVRSPGADRITGAMI